MSPAAKDNHGDGGAAKKAGGDVDDEDNDDDDEGTAILAKQLFSVHNGRLDKFGTGFEKDETGSEEEEVQFVDLVKRSYRSITGVKVVLRKRDAGDRGRV